MNITVFFIIFQVTNENLAYNKMSIVIIIIIFFSVFTNDIYIKFSKTEGFSLSRKEINPNTGTPSTHIHTH